MLELPDPPKRGWRGKLEEASQAGVLARRAGAEARKAAQTKATTWAPRPEMVCPHCQTKGQVTTILTQEKRGISGGKATAAVLTAGISLVATGLSRKELLTKAHCYNCGVDWMF